MDEGKACSFIHRSKSEQQDEYGWQKCLWALEYIKYYNTYEHM